MSEKSKSAAKAPKKPAQLLGQLTLSSLPVIGPSAAIVSLTTSSILEHLEQNRSKKLSEKEQLALVEWQVKLAKEYAIARRIDTAETVTIEEFYETRGEGSIDAAVSAMTESGKGSIRGSGQRVTHRVYKFEGVRDLTAEEVSQMESFFQRTSFSQDDPKSEEK